MAKRKSKMDLIEKALDGEIETPVIETTDLASKPRSFKLQFFGREYVEERFPESLHWADRFAAEWVNEGDFDFIKLSNPRAQEALVLGLKNIRAVEKNLEKKVEEAYSEYSEKLAPYAKKASEKVEQIVSKLRH